MKSRTCLMMAMAFMLLAVSSWGAAITVGSKSFTENIILGKIVVQLLESEGHRVNQKMALGGTEIAFSALKSGAIDIYVDYSGTLKHEILENNKIYRRTGSFRKALEGLGVIATKSLGFQNRYAIGMKKKTAVAMGITSISDLKDHPMLRYGFTNEFMDREDGARGLFRMYGLNPEYVTGLEYSFAYKGIESDAIDVTVLYTTDARALLHEMIALEDDLNYFGDYSALILVRKATLTRVPDLLRVLQTLEGEIDTATMMLMNKNALIGKNSESTIASGYLRKNFAIEGFQEEWGRAAQILNQTVEHLFLVLISMLLAVLFAVPLGIIASKYVRLGKVILGVVSVLQTIPSLALLVLFIPLLGIGNLPALAALFFYSLLPIVRNTFLGFTSIPATLRETALVMGLSPLFRLLRVELPLASPAILSGIKTAVVINIGTATLGALVGSGGYGQAILTGIRLNDIGMTMQGAIPAAMLALFAQWGFDGLEKVLVPKGLRLQSRMERL